MIVTSFGLGPFHPAIAWYDRLWIAEVSFETEDEAIAAAEVVVSYLNGRATEYIVELGYSSK
jgi:hypothetical protein